MPSLGCGSLPLNLYTSLVLAFWEIQGPSVLSKLTPKGSYDTRVEIQGHEIVYKF